MARGRRFNSSRSGTRSRRRHVWVRTDIGSGTATAAATVDLLADWRTRMGLTANLPGTTVSRIRGAVQFNSPDATPGAASGALVAIRKDVLGETPTAASVQPEADWMYFEWVPTSQGWSGGSGSSGLFSRGFDVRSQRRMDEIAETLWLSWEATADADTLTSYGWISMLLTLP